MFDERSQIILEFGKPRLNFLSQVASLDYLFPSIKFPAIKSMPKLNLDGFNAFFPFSYAQHFYHLAITNLTVKLPRHKFCPCLGASSSSDVLALLLTADFSRSMQILKLYFQHWRIPASKCLYTPLLKDSP
ncbi:hypothetical protein HYU13_06055 [Candidatus Woesearchaeota archaeon]|nr:hypothetical protein [Candidatus Woesearchaeota archaeon]